MLLNFFFFFFKQKTAYEMLRSLVGSEMCIRDRIKPLNQVLVRVILAIRLSLSSACMARFNDFRRPQVINGQHYKYSPAGSSAPPAGQARSGGTLEVLKPWDRIQLDKLPLDRALRAPGIVVLYPALDARMVVHVPAVPVGYRDSGFGLLPELEVEAWLLQAGLAHAAVLRDVLFPHGDTRHLHELHRNIRTCLLYTSDAADEEDSVDLGGRRIIKKKKKKRKKKREKKTKEADKKDQKRHITKKRKKESE
eukprot:TRINITY_DN10178_c0_g1_i2.p1 TRINITY_DN10178_c0_g1~~TRINITY_DN10178_c0_g1_i2.p1  ORF type:complete len:251 (+),score=47.68 TRINITY_DN10178_c0_g1_i2:120-872(+)